MAKFCGRCGTNIADDALFCPECGEKIILNDESISNEIIHSHKKIINSKTKKAILIVILIFAVLFCGIKTVNYITSIPTSKEIKQVSNNLENNSFVASDGKWLLYFDNGDLCKEKLSTGKNKQSVIEKRTSGEMFYLGNKLYIESLSAYSITDLKGKKMVEIPNTTFCENKFQTDGKTCYFDSFSSDIGKICSQKFNGKSIKNLSDISVSSIKFDGKYLYLFSPYDKVNDHQNLNKGVTRINTDGSKEIHILDFCPSYFVFYEERIYYTDNNSLYSMKLDGSDKRQCKDIKVGDGLNIYDGYIYYVDYSTDNICKVGIEKDSYTKVLTDCSSAGISIFKDWIIYKNEDELAALYKVKLDGTQNQIISN